MKASDKDRILNSLELSKTVKLSTLTGDTKLNAIICYSLRDDGCIYIYERETSDDFNIRLSDKGKYYKEWGGYSRSLAGERKSKYKKIAWNAFCYVLGIVTGVVGQYVLFLLTQKK